MNTRDSPVQLVSPSHEATDGWDLADGTRIRVRSLAHDDREREVDFVESLSEQTRYFRLMTPLRYLSPTLLDQLMDVDDANRAALVATTTLQDKEKFVAVARYASTDAPGEVELGITVADAWQKRGIGTRLLALLCEHARSRGMRRMVGFVLPENQRMLDLARKLGFIVHFSHERRLMTIERLLTTKSSEPST